MLIEEVTEENPLVVYFIVNGSLGMSAGKTAAQVAHALHIMLMQYYKSNNTTDLLYRMQTWQDLKINGGFRKVVLVAESEKEWANIKESHNHVVVVDAGLTEIPPNSETVIGIFPILKSERCKTLKRLRCLK